MKAANEIASREATRKEGPGNVENVTAFTRSVGTVKSPS
jgi:hypothetical protein